MLKPVQNIVFDFEFLTEENQLAAYDEVMPPRISIAMSTLEQNDKMLRVFNEILEPKLQARILNEKFMRESVWNNLPPQDPEIWKSMEEIREDCADFIFRNRAQKINLCYKGGAGIDAILFHRMWGPDIRQMWNALQDKGIRKIDFVDTQRLRDIFSAHVSPEDINKRVPYDNDRMHAADYDVERECNIIAESRELVPFALFEAVFPG